MECSHYTSLTGLHSILSTKVLRFTNILFLNDQNEYLDAIMHIKNLLLGTKEKEKNPIWPNLSEYNELIKNSLPDLEDGYRELNFTLSLSREHDLLSQWRGYCQLNNGYGIVFDTDIIEESAQKLFKYIYHRECIYLDKLKRKEIKNILNEYYRHYKDSNDDFESDKLPEFLFEVDQTACFMKDITFSEENEVRVVVSLLDKEKDNIKFRAGNGTLIPYVEIPFPENAVIKIIVGPTIDPQRAEKALSQFLAINYKGSEPEIVHSKIPFRSW